MSFGSDAKQVWRDYVVDGVPSSGPNKPNKALIRGLFATIASAIAVTPEEFGAIGDGVADDTVAMNSFFAAVQGNYGILTGQYRVTSLLVSPFINCRLIGVPGQTKIFGAFGYAVLQLEQISNAHFHNILFQTNYVNAVEDPTYSTVYSTKDDVYNSGFWFCSFSSPNANTSGLTFYTRPGVSDTNTVDGLWIEDCVFLNVGRIGCTIMNRSTTSDKYDAMKRVYFNRNLGRNLGLSGTFGFLVSFDGYGQAFSCNDNRIENGLTIGIENTGWINGEISNNTGEDFSRVWCLLSIDGTNGGGNRIMTGLKVTGNKTKGSASARSSILYVTDSYFAGNNFDLTAVSDLDEAMLMRGVQHCKFFGETYTNRSVANKYALYVEHDTSNNDWVDCTFDNSATAGNNAAIAFSDTGSVGTNTTGNRVINPRIEKGTGGFLASQINGAIGNVVYPSVSNDNANPANFTIITFPSDADFTVTSPQDVLSIPVTQINGTLTSGRTLNFASAACFSTPRTMKNHTTQTITLAVAGVAGDTIAAGVTATVFYGGSTLNTP